MIDLTISLANLIKAKTITQKPHQQYFILFSLILAGELIFSLPFHIPRFFRPDVLDVFQISNTQLGDIFAVYGIIAMLAYFPGGTIADHFSARKLMTFSLVSTAIGGLYLYTIPNLIGLYWLFAYWGLTSVLLFWAAMIKATRDWGGNNSQGKAFGILDGGRGLTASIFASIAVFIFAQMVDGAIDNQQEHQDALQTVVLFYSLVTAAVALVIWFTIPESPASEMHSIDKIGQDIFHVVKNANVWLQGGIIIAAYCGFKSLDNYGIYAVQVLNLDNVEAAKLNNLASYARPIAAIAAGVIADKWRSSSLVNTLFAIAALVFIALSMTSPQQSGHVLILGNVLISYIAVYALRGIYFALVEESKVNSALTGTAVGLISVIGYTPDIFFAPITGRILDANPGLTGFQNYFLLMGFISLVGIILTFLLKRNIRNP